MRFWTIIPIMSIIIAATVTLSALMGCSGDSSSPPPAYSIINGTAKYEDKQYSPTGFTGQTDFNPIRFAAVEVVDSVNMQVLARGYTSASGRFELGFLHTAGTSAYVRVISSTSGGGEPDVSVKTPFSGSLYAVYSASLELSSGVSESTFINVPAYDSAGGAFNILDVMTAAGQFVNSLSSTMPPALVAFWIEGGAIGTFYIPLSGSIYILGTSDDTDEYDDDVLWHEYGHFAADMYAEDDSPGDTHSFAENDQDIRLSWSEGYSNYFQAALKRWLLNTPGMSQILSLATGTAPTYYIDTDYTGARVALDLNNPEPEHIYSTNEVSVAHVLLDLDLEPAYGPGAIWDILTGSMPLSPYYTSMESFWDGWLYTQGASDMINSITADRQIYYIDDVYEAFGDDSANATRLATLGAPEVHYLYNSSGQVDTDYIAFEATISGNYTIETYCMKNGADTYLEVLDTDGITLIASDDDTLNIVTCIPDKFSDYTSKITANITTPGTYYAVVNTSTTAKTFNPPDVPATGRYGTYTIRITGP